MTSRPLVLLSNDDGYAAPGLQALRRALEVFADVVVCAPETNQSATSHSLTLHRILRLRSPEPNVFSVDGTPADCVYVALHSAGRVLARQPDLCVSGMNHGLNLGVDVFYSGTVAAAREAALRGIPSVAVSADIKADPSAAARAGADVARALLEAQRGSASRAALLNVNIPPGDTWPVRATRLGARVYGAEVVFRTDPRGGEYLWIGGSAATHHDSPGADTEAYDEGVIGVTSLALDLSDPAGATVAGEIASRMTAPSA
jgi:5'-nucleotidase